MQIHKNIFSALQHPSVWAAFAGIMSSMGAQLDKPCSISCYGLSALFSMIAIMVKTPEGDAKENPHDSDNA